MKKITVIICRYKEIFFMLLVTGIIYLFLFYKKTDIETTGVLTVAKVVRWGSAESGGELFIEIYYQKKTYPTTLNLTCQNKCVGNYYFIKINKRNPLDYPIFYEDKQVPECILFKEKDFFGWNDFPNCDSLSIKY